MAIMGQRVLLVDFDPQGNAGSGLGLDKEGLQNTIYDVLINGVNVEKAVVEGPVEGLYVLPARIELAGAEVELVAMEGRNTCSRA
jgi:chromosome partitioning protein